MLRDPSKTADKEIAVKVNTAKISNMLNREFLNFIKITKAEDFFKIKDIRTNDAIV